MNSAVSAPRARRRSRALRCGLLCGVLLWLAPAAAAQAGSARGASAAIAPPALAVTGASLTVADTGQRLYGIHPDRRLLIASTTKLMTALVVFQHVHDFSTIFTHPDWRAAPDDSQIGLVPGERMSVHDLMLALLLPSADDAAYDLAYNVGHGSVARFVAEMNADAVALGLHHTHYANPIGFDQAGNYSSPYDLTRLAAYMLAHHPFFARAVALTHATLHTGDYVREITNTDTLLGVHPWITGVKTGHTDAAGYILVSSGTRHGLTLVASVLGTTSEAARNASALALLGYGFAAFRPVAPLHRGQVLARLPVREEHRRAAVVADAGWRRVVPRFARVRLALALPRMLAGPRAARTRVGTATVLVNGRAAARVALVLSRRVPAVPLLTRLARAAVGPTTLGGLALCVGLLLAVLALRRRRGSADARRRAELEAR
ncbi:MAG TPA: hypothetical protein VFN48_11185 [Solirubrobacteraceae bacterium]|nr:hypothetical protein [Solirubrobacteraceae bacterium]